jgi:hypothetical protein
MAQRSGKETQRRRLDEAKAKKRRVQETVWIGGDPDVLAELADKEKRRRQLETSIQVRDGKGTEADRSSLAEVLSEIEDLKMSLRETAVPYTMQAVGHKRFDALLKEHPPTEDQVAMAKAEGENITFNLDTFPYALIDLSCIDPEHELGEMQAWLKDDPDDEWNFAEVNDLFQAALKVNNDRSRAALG